MARRKAMIVLSALIAACSQQPTVDSVIETYAGVIAVDLSGYWERDYSRGDEVDSKLRQLFYDLGPAGSGQRYPGNAGMGNPGMAVSSRDVSSILALARLADLITRPDVLTIQQSDYEVSIEREDDFAMLCQFYGGAAKRTASDYGTEVCGWDGEQLVSNLVLPDGLLISHRFAISNDGEHLRVVTTVSSSTARVPFSLSRYYRKFDAPTSDFNCIETLSMKRVCSTGELEP
jgi:hypothetical protein